MLNASPASRKRTAIAVGLLACVVLTFSRSQPATTPSGGQEGHKFKRTAPYVPTPMDVVEKMLEVADVVPNDVVYDLGSGDGRIVIMAAQKFGARAVGVEINGDLYKKSSERIAALGLEKRARIIYENMFEVSVRPATVVTLYLLTAVNEELRPRLEKQLRPGTRVVCHDYTVPEWTATKTFEVTSPNGAKSTIYLYIR